MGAAVRVAGEEVLRKEIQVQAVDTARNGRPAVPGVADAHQIARVRKAVARGGVCLRLFREATQRKTVGTVVWVADVEALRIETQVQTVDVACGGRPDEPAVADVPQRTLIEGAEARGGLPRPFLI